MEEVVRVDRVGEVQQRGHDPARHAPQHLPLRLLRVEDDENFARLVLHLLQLGDLHVQLQQPQR